MGPFGWGTGRGGSFFPELSFVFLSCRDCGVLAHSKAALRQGGYMKRFLYLAITGLVVHVSASLLDAQQPDRLERDSVSATLPVRAAADSAPGTAAGAGGCPVGEIPDCNGNCAPDNWAGDGDCDLGQWSWGGNPIFLNCEAFDCDGGDCAPELCISSVCGNGIVEPGEACDDGNATPGDGCSPTCQIEIGVSTYSVHHMIGEELITGERRCFRLWDPALPGEPDDIVTFDGLMEYLATDINGVAAGVTESETNNPDGTVSVSITATSPSLTDLFPAGFVSPDTSQPLTGACWFIGIDDLLDRTPALTVQSATLAFFSDGLPVVGPADVAGVFATSPWDGFFGVWVPGAAGQFTNRVQLDIVFARADTNACPGTGECCVDNGTPGCADTSCCGTICAADPYCCGNDPDLGGFWDDICAAIAMTLCPDAPSCAALGDCCAVHPEPGCDDPACLASVCDVDPFCCSDGWDEICVEETAQICGICTTGACCWDTSCETPGTCEAPVLCGTGCACFEVAEGGGGCSEFLDCVDAISCPNGSQDCPAGQQCYVNTCCDGPVCYPDCAVGGAAAASVGGLTERSSRAARVGAGAASRGSVMTCTESTDVFCTNFGGLYQGDAALCSDADMCNDCTQAANIDLAALALTDYLCDSTLSRSGKNVLRFEFDTPVAAPLPGEIEINELQGPGAFGPDISALFDITVENGNVLTIREVGTLFANETWYAIRNVGNWCDAANFEVDYGVAFGDADGLGGTGFSDLAAIFDVIQNGPPSGSMPDSSRFDIDGLGGVGFGDLSAAFGFVGSTAGSKPGPAGCSP